MLLDELESYDERRIKSLLLEAWGQGCAYRRVGPMLDALRDAGVKQTEIAEVLGMTKQAVGAWYRGKVAKAIKITPHAENALVFGFRHEVGSRYRPPSLQQQHAFGVRWAMWKAATEVMGFADEGPPDGPALSALVHVWSSSDWYDAFIHDEPAARQNVINDLWAYMRPRWGARLEQDHLVISASTCYTWFREVLVDWFEPYLLTSTYLLQALCPPDIPPEVLSETLPDASTTDTSHAGGNHDA